MKRIIAFALAVAMILGCMMTSYTDSGYSDDPDYSLVDDTYYLLRDYHKAAEGSVEQSNDKNASFQYLKVKTLCGQDKATEYYNTVISTMDLGAKFDKKATTQLSQTMIREMRAGLAAEQRPIDTPMPMPTLAQEGNYKVFPDVANDAWYAEAVNGMSTGGLLKGYDDGLFHPNEYITYGEWATIMCRVATLTPRTITPDASYQHWAAGYQDSAIPSGLSTENGRGNCEGFILRGEAIWCVRRGVDNDSTGFEQRLAAKYTGNTWTLADIPDNEILVANENQISDHGTKNTGFWKADMIVEAYNLGITQGVDGIGTCNPMGKLTRAEAAQMLWNIGVTTEGAWDFGASSHGMGTLGSSSSGLATK